MSVLEGDCADGTLDGPARYYLHYRERTQNKEEKVFHLEHEVIISAHFQDDVPTRVTRRYGRTSSMAMGNAHGGADQGAGWTRVSFAYADAESEDAPSLSFHFQEDSNESIATYLRQPRPDGGWVMTMWEGMRQTARETYDANGNSMNRQGQK